MKNLMKILSVFVMIFAVLALTGCAPKDVESAKEKMTEAGYFCAGFEGEKAEGYVGGFMATKLTENLFASLYDSSKSAKDALEKLESTIGENKNVQVVGKWLVWGSEAAIKAFK